MWFETGEERMQKKHMRTLLHSSACARALACTGACACMQATEHTYTRAYMRARNVTNTARPARPGDVDIAHVVVPKLPPSRRYKETSFNARHAKHWRSPNTTKHKRLKALDNISLPVRMDSETSLRTVLIRLWAKWTHFIVDVATPKTRPCVTR
eukprot:2524210-Pleurochrysis_carterae.AAC.1